MRDWRTFARERLSLEALQRKRADRIVEELAGQLEEIHAGALARGASAREAEAEVERHVADWERLASDVVAAESRHRQPASVRWLHRAEDTARRAGVAGRLIAELLLDVRYALRGFRRSPSFALGVIVILGVGISAAAAMLSVLSAVVLAPLPYPDPESLVSVWTDTPASQNYRPFSTPNYRDVRERSTSFQEFGVQTLTSLDLSGGGVPERLVGSLCSASFLRVFRTHPAAGRLFTDGEEAGRAAVVVLSHSLWQRRFAGDPDMVGSTITLNREVHTVVGIMPEGFMTPLPWPTGARAELWIPLASDGNQLRRDWNWLRAVARLAPGVTLESAEAEAQILAATLEAENPEANARFGLWLQPLEDFMTGPVREPLWFLLAAVGLLLLVACANVASVVLARSMSRQPLVAIRTSLGASRGRLVRQLVVENMVLASGAGLLGAALAWWGAAALRGWIPATVERAETIHLDGRVLVLVVVLTLVCGLLIGVVPALLATRPRIAGLLGGAARTFTSDSRRARLRTVLLVVQLALTLVLANGTALMLRSYAKVMSTPMHFDREYSLTVAIVARGAGHEGEAERWTFWQGLMERVAAIPGVEAVGATRQLPLEGGENNSYLVQGQEFDPDVYRQNAETSYASADYFAAMGIPLLAGRTFASGDVAGARRGVVANRTFAELHWPGESALGKEVFPNAAQAEWVGTIVGVVESVPQWSLDRRLQPEVYSPYPYNPYRRGYLVVRSVAAPGTVVPAIRRVVAALDPDLPLASIRTMNEVVMRDVAPRRFQTTLVQVFAAIALLLVGVGVYGVLSFHVAQRRHEVGIRMAVGARRSSVGRLFLGHSLVVAAAGVSLGIVASSALSRLIAGLLHGVAAIDPVSLGLAALVILVIAMAGAGLPAFRAASVDPVETLRSE